MKTLLVSLSAVMLLGAAVASPALAVSGQEAIDKCNKVHNCTVYDGPGGILIFGPKGGVVDCPDKKSQCTATARENNTPTVPNGQANQASPN